MKFTLALASLAVSSYALPSASTTKSDLMLLKFSADSEPKQVTKEEKLEFMRNGTRFVSGHG